MSILTRDLEKAERQRREAERVAEDLRVELDEQRRRQEREETERAERRREEMRAATPSNRLYRGEIRNAREAIEAHIAALRYEQSRDIIEPEDSDAPDPLKENPWPKWIDESERLLREYIETVGAAERALAERWASQPEGSYANTFADAILNSDYSRLAI